MFTTYITKNCTNSHGNMNKYLIIIQVYTIMIKILIELV